MASDAKRTTKIGRLGEILLHRLATEAGLTVSKPENDENGWDRILEFPANRVPNVFLDGQPSALKCLVQIKSSDKPAPRVSMEVSNFNHLAKNPMPTFFFFVYFAGGDAPIAAHLSHFHSEWIGKTLQKIRSLQAEGISELHKHKMVFTAKDGELLPELDATALLAAINGFAGIDADDYALKKIEILRTIGFDSERAVGRFNIHATPEEFSRALVGLTSVHIENGEIYERRFGIDLKERDLTTGKLIIRPRVAGRCTVTAAGSDMSRPVRIEADVILPAAQDLPPELMRSVVRNDNILVEIHNDEGNVEFSVSDDQEYELSDLSANLEFMLKASQPGTEITFSKDGIDFGSTEIQRDMNAPDSYFQLARTLRVVKDLLQFAEIPKPHTITLTQLRKQTEEIYWADLAMRQIECTLSSNFHSGNDDIQTREGTFSRPIIIRCGKQHHFMMFYWDATIILGAKKVKARISNRQLWDAKTFHEDDSPRGVEDTLKRFEHMGRKRRGNTLMSAKVTFSEKVPSRPVPRPASP